MKIKKCQFGYIKYRRKVQGIKTFTGIAIITAFVVAGVLIFGSKANYLTVIGAVLSLPVAKIAVNYILFLCYHPADKELYEQVNKLADQCICDYDCIVTSKEKVMPVQAAVVTPNVVCALTDSDKVDPKAFEKSMKEFLAEGKHKNVTVQLYKDRNQFFKRIEFLNANINQENIEEVKERAGWVNETVQAMCL